jgi:hypothetical protein
VDWGDGGPTMGFFGGWAGGACAEQMPRKHTKKTIAAQVVSTELGCLPTETSGIWRIPPVRWGRQSGSIREATSLSSMSSREAGAS